MMIDKEYLLKALNLAFFYRGVCSPNPSVGAVVVKNGRILATGCHQGPGTAHAEPAAFSLLSNEDAKDSTVYVTLEPCCHHGRTPPCTDLLIRKQVARVVYGYQDPNPIVDGRGHEKLTAAGTVCHYQPLAEINTFYESYAYWHRHHRPFLTAKLAMSADGKIAEEGGRPVKITNELTNQFTHQQRKISDAILTSVKTIIQDDPQLNVRIAGVSQSKPIYIIDRLLQFPLNPRLMNTASSITLFYDERLRCEPRPGINYVPTPCHKNKLDLDFILNYLGQQGFHDVWLEAGATLFKAFALSGLAQKAYIYQAPCHLGKAAYAANLPDHLGKDFQKKEVFFLGEDKVTLLMLKKEARFSGLDPQNLA